VLDLSASINPFALDPGPIVARHIAAGALARYPDALDVSNATTALASALQVDPGRVLITNGGAEAIALVADALGPGWVDEPEFSLYRRHLRALDPDGPKWRSDPHNPTGLLARDDEAADIWDEAFYPLVTGRWTRRPLPGGPPQAARDRPALVIGSLTKVLGCPGLRLGYVVVPEDDGAVLGHPGLRDGLVRRQPRWSVSTPALAAVPELLEQADIVRWAQQIGEARTELVGVLVSYGMAVRPSDAPYVLVDGAEGLRNGLSGFGIAVRDCASFGMPETVRIAVPDADGLDRLTHALQQVLVSR